MRFGNLDELVPADIEQMLISAIKQDRTNILRLCVYQSIA